MLFAVDGYGEESKIYMSPTNLLDQFYTAPHEVEKCMVSWYETVEVNKNDVVIEPSAGAGAFSSQIEDCIAYDLEPRADAILKQDFLKLDFSQFNERPIHFIGNPPFGKCSKLAFAFINKIISYKDTVSFSLILPASHSRDIYKNKIDKHFHLIHEHSVKDFIEFGKKKQVNCVFQIWEKRNQPRQLVDLNPKTTLISFTSNAETCDFKIGNHKQIGIILTKNYTYKQENRGSFKMIVVHDKSLYNYLQDNIGKRLVCVDRAKFVSVPSVTNCEVVKAIIDVMSLIKNGNENESAALFRIREACASIVKKLGEE